MIPAEQRLVEFVVWEMRGGDLPDDVRRAAEEAAPLHPRPAGVRRVTEGSLIVSTFPSDESQPIERRKVFPHQAGGVVEEFLRDRPSYVLITDNS